VFQGQGDSLGPGGSFGYDPNITLFLQEFADALAYYSMVVGQHNADHFSLLQDNAPMKPINN
jgi:hypothetical protein